MPAVHNFGFDHADPVSTLAFLAPLASRGRQKSDLPSARDILATDERSRSVRAVSASQPLDHSMLRRSNSSLGSDLAECSEAYHACVSVLARACIGSACGLRQSYPCRRTDRAADRTGQRLDLPVCRSRRSAVVTVITASGYGQTFVRKSISVTPGAHAGQWTGWAGAQSPSPGPTRTLRPRPRHGFPRPCGRAAYWPTSSSSIGPKRRCPHVANRRRSGQEARGRTIINGADVLRVDTAGRRARWTPHAIQQSCMGLRHRRAIIGDEAVSRSLGIAGMELPRHRYQQGRSGTRPVCRHSRAHAA